MQGRCGAIAPVRCKAPSDAEGIASIGKNYRKKGEVYGFDGGKKVKGRKRHILVDTLGLLLKVIVTEGNGSERINGLALLLESQEHIERLKLIWVDQGYQGERFERAVEHLSSATVEEPEKARQRFSITGKKVGCRKNFCMANQKTSFDSGLRTTVRNQRIAYLLGYGSSNAEKVNFLSRLVFLIFYLQTVSHSPAINKLS